MTTRFAPLSHLLLRVVAGFLFMCHGGQKLFGWFGGVGPVPGTTVPWLSQMGLAGVLEFFGGFLVLIGLATRPVAFLLSGEMAVAYFMVHQPQGPLPIQNHGEPAVLFCFTYLFLAFHGAGRLSVDGLMRLRAAAGASGNDANDARGPGRPLSGRAA